MNYFIDNYHMNKRAIICSIISVKFEDIITIITNNLINSNLSHHYFNHYFNILLKKQLVMQY